MVKISIIRRILPFCALLAASFTQGHAAEPITGHPRLWLRADDLPRLRSWATERNPIYTALVELAVQWKTDMDGTPASADAPAQPPRVPQEDTGDWQPETYAAEKYAQLFAFMSLISPQAAVRDDYARRARILLLHVMNQACWARRRAGRFGSPDFSPRTPTAPARWARRSR